MPNKTFLVIVQVILPELMSFENNNYQKLK